MGAHVERPSLTARRARSLFFVGFAVPIAALVVAGFTRTFFIPLARSRFSAPWFVYVHGTLFFCWASLLIVQALLITSRKLVWHQRLGWAAAGLIPLMVVSGVVVAVWSTTRDVRAGQGDSAISLFFGELVDMVVFATFACAALLTRRRPEIHRRLILFATLALLGAAVGRIQILGGLSNWITLGLLGTIALRDEVRLRHLHPATLWGGLLLIADVLVQSYAAATAWWLTAGRGVLSVLH